MFDKFLANTFLWKKFSDILKKSVTYPFIGNILQKKVKVIEPRRRGTMMSNRSRIIRFWAPSNQTSKMTHWPKYANYSQLRYLTFSPALLV